MFRYRIKVFSIFLQSDGKSKEEFARRLEERTKELDAIIADCAIVRQFDSHVLLSKKC